MMVFSARNAAWYVIVIASLLTACKTTRAAEAKPALITDTSQTAQKAVAVAVSKAVGAKVTLAPESFISKPSVTIEPPSVNKRNGQIIDGRSLEMPTHVDLIMMGRNCYIVNRETGDKYPLKGVKCETIT